MVYLSNFVQLNFCANMKYFIGLSLLLLSNFTNGQKIIQSYNEVVLTEEFDSNINEWPIKNSNSESFHILDQSYNMERLSEDYFSIVFAKQFQEFDDFELSARIRVPKQRGNKEASGGIVFRAEKSGEDAVVLEINGKRHYRLLLIRNGSLMPFYKNENDGWVKSADLLASKYNKIVIKTEGSFIDLYINDVFQESFNAPEVKPGTVGFFIGAMSKMVVDQLLVSQVAETEAAQDETVEEQRGMDENGFKEILLVFRVKIEKQRNAIEKLESELAICNSNFTIDTTLGSRVNTLIIDNNQLSKKLSETEEKLFTAQNRLEYLESMKNDIEGDPDGDLIIRLTELLAEEKSENFNLKKEIAELKKQL
jgi:hypothetical protein